MNNSMELFNATIKRSYTLEFQHILPALHDILECLTLAVYLDFISGRKELCLSINSASKEIQVQLADHAGVHDMQLQLYIQCKVLYILPGFGL
jgi:hypothetical protein